ncbi:MAG: hypothetical protein D6820_13295, partial [Lentisphaerae bacterium]
YEDRGAGRVLASIYAMIDQLDWNIGRLLQHLSTLGIAEDTIVIFLSDNGPQFFGYDRMPPEDCRRRYPSGMKGHKGSMWENGIRVPCFVCWPGHFKSREVSALADIHDILPTLIDLCGLDQAPPGHLPLDGQSLRPVLEGTGELAAKEHVIFSNIGWPPMKAEHEMEAIARKEYEPVPPDRIGQLDFMKQLCGLRTEDRKLLRNPGYAEGAPAAFGGDVLIDMKSDPLENRNLAALQAEEAGRLRLRLQTWFREIQQEPHAWHVPIFRIGPGSSNQLFLYAPQRNFGHVWNSGLASHDWLEPGDGAEYLIEVTSTGRYHVELEAREFEGEEVLLQFALDDDIVHTLRATAASGHIGSLQLPAGRHVLKMMLAGRPQQPVRGHLNRLVSLSFQPEEGLHIDE